MKDVFSNNRKLIFFFLKGSSRYFVTAWFFSCLVSIFNLINPKVIEYIIDDIIALKKMDRLPMAVGA
ncbi:MAG: hypothetical protein K6F00_10875, partial [Lachnospiraceae bacterium]|nr:hypothetical protein [Lachnospiraceae bacterium]